MNTITFKAPETFKKNLMLISQSKGINMSAYIKLVLTTAMKAELTQLTKNGITIKDEISILNSAMFDAKNGPFENADNLMEALKKKK
jgi:hypothetical protein